MLIVFDLNQIAALLGCAALLVFYVLHWRSGIRGFGLLVVGESVIVGMYRSNGSIGALIGIVLVGIFVAVLFVTLHTLVVVRRKRVAVYVPPARRRRPAQVTRLVRK